MIIGHHRNNARAFLLDKNSVDVVHGDFFNDHLTGKFSHHSLPTNTRKTKRFFIEENYNTTSEIASIVKDVDSKDYVKLIILSSVLFALLFRLFITPFIIQKSVNFFISNYVFKLSKYIWTNAFRI